jgi:hypothetical protein
MAPHISFPSSSGAASFSFSSGGGLADREQRAHGGELVAAGYREWRADGSELGEGGGIRWRRADGGAAVDQATAPAMATATTARRAAAAALGLGYCFFGFYFFWFFIFACGRHNQHTKIDFRVRLRHLHGKIAIFADTFLHS